MRKSTLFVLAIFFAANVFGQYTQNQTMGTANTLVSVPANGGLRAALINRTFTDTTAANSHPIKTYPFAQIGTTGDGNMWVRNYLATGWVLLGGGTSPSGTFWRIGGNMFPVSAPTRDIGTDATYGGAVGLMTNGVVRAIVPNGGFVLDNDTSSNKIFTINPSTKEWGYSNWNNGGGATSLSSLTAATSGNDINNADYNQIWRWNTLSSGVGVTLATTSTASTDAGHTLFGIDMQGANANSNQTTYAGSFVNSHTGTTSTNIGLLLQAYGGTNNYPLDLGVEGSNLGRMRLNGSTSGSIVIQPAAAAGTYTLTLPTTDGNSGEFLQTNGSGALTWAAAGSGTPAGNYGNVQLNRNGVLATPASDSLDFDGGLSIKGTLTVSSRASGAITDSVLTVNASSGLVNQKAMTVINTASRDSGDVIQWNGSTNVYVPLPSGSTNLFGTSQFQIGITTNAPDAGDSTVTNTNWVNKRVFVYREGWRQDSSATNGYTFDKAAGTITVHPPWATNERMQVDAYDTTTVYTIALEEPIIPSVDLDLNANRSNLTKTGTVFTPTANNTSFDAYGQDALIIPSGQSGRFFSQYVTSGDNTYMLFVNTSSTFLPYSDANSQGLYVNGSNQIQPLNSGTPGSSVGSVTAGSWYGIYRDIGAGNIRIQSSTDGVSWSDVATLSAYSSADLYLSIVIYSVSGKKVSNPKGQGVQ